MDKDLALQINRLKKAELSLLLDFIRPGLTAMTQRNAVSDAEMPAKTGLRASHAS